MAPTKPQLSASNDAMPTRLTGGGSPSIASSQAARLGQSSDAVEISRRERIAFIFGVAFSRIIGELPQPSTAPAIEEIRREDNRIIDIIIGPRRRGEVEEVIVEAPQAPPPTPPPPPPPSRSADLVMASAQEEQEVVAATTPALLTLPAEDAVVQAQENEVLAEAQPPTREDSEGGSIDSVEKGAEEAATTSPPLTPQARKRSLEEDPRDKFDQRPMKIRSVEKKVKFSKKVAIQHRRRTLAICERRPFVLMGSPTLDEFQPLRRPTIHVRPRRFSRQAIEALVAEADPETIDILDSTPKPTGCQESCSSDGCSESCSCAAEGLPCSSRYGCRCNFTNCNHQKHTPIPMEEHLKKKAELVESANKKTADWDPTEDSTISSVGSCSFDEEEIEVAEDGHGSMTEDGEAMEEGEEDVSNVSMIGEDDVEDDEGENDEAMADQADELEVVGVFDDDDGNFEGSGMDWSPPPPSPTIDSEAGPSDIQPQMNDTMVLCEDEDEDLQANLPSSNPPSDSSDGSSSDPDDDDDEEDDADDDDDDDNDNNGLPGFDMAPEGFSSHLLRQLPALLDQGEVDSCNIGQLLGGDALFVGLLRVATAAKQTSGSNCAVCHPEVFEAARRTIEAEANPGAGPAAVLTQLLVKQYTAYGHDWSDIVIPMLLDNHWIVAVVRRSLVSVTIYDSLPNPRHKELVIKAIKKILGMMVRIDPEDKYLLRFKIRYCRDGCRDVQTDGSSCGLFVINHARRALQRNTNSAGKRAMDAAIDVAKERMELRQELVEIVGAFQRMAAIGVRWRHIQGGQLPLRSARTLVAVKYSGRRL